MLFSCPPSEIVSSILENLAFSGQNGMTLKEMWEFVREKLQVTAVDEFQKQVIWQWLFFSNNPLQQYVTREDTVIAATSGYASFLAAEGDETQLRIMPNPDTQCKYLTGISNFKKLKLQLGENPFQLLCEIAKYGAKGIHAPDLCKVTGQDPRSLTPRLKKLEELGFIRKKNVYNEKSSQHTSLCVHTKFSEDEVELSMSDFGEEFDSSRNVSKLKQFIIQSLKEAPNKLRGFKDLKRELKLDKERSSSKFFRGIIEYLHTHGYAEKLMVKDPNQTQLVYCIKFVRDIPKDADEISDYVDLFKDILAQQQDEDEDEEDYTSSFLPVFNKFYPLSNQIYSKILSSRELGVTSMELIRNLTGNSDYRPIVKLLDSLTSYVLDHNNATRLKHFSDPYDETSIIRAYDFEGKFKFYRYFSTHFSEHVSSDATLNNSSKASPNNLGLRDLNSKYYRALGKTPLGSLINLKKRKADESRPGLKRPKNLQGEEITIKRSRGRPRKFDAGIEALSILLNNDSVFKESSNEPVSDTLESTADIANPQNLTNYPPEEIVKTDEVSTLEDASKQKFKRKNVAAKSGIHVGSLKATKRRAELIDIIKCMGGVTYTTANLCRHLDERLGNSTVTDKKTLARDVSLLIESNELEVQDIKFIRSGQPISRKLLILCSPEFRPSPEKIEEIKQQCLVDKRLRPNGQFNRRVIEGEVTMFSKPFEKESQPKRTKKGRLDSLSQNGEESAKTSSNTIVMKEENDEVEEDPKEKQIGKEPVESLNSILSSKSRRRRKPAVKRETSVRDSTSLTKRSRVPVKFDGADATILYRAVVISKTFKRGAIDFSYIATLFENMAPEEVKLKWTQVRKRVGGLNAVSKGVTSFEHVVLKGIEEGIVGSSDLNSLNLQFFLELWKDSDGSTLELMDETPLYNDYKENLVNYDHSILPDNSVSLFDHLEDNSMKQKEMILSKTTFSYENPADMEPKPLDHERTILKAIFATPEDEFESERVNQILSDYPEEVIKKALLALIKDKELSHYTAEDSDTRFVLTDKVYNTFILKVFTTKFFHHAGSFKNDLSSVTEASKGFIISKGISGGQIAALLNFISREAATVGRIDIPYKFTGYESRLIDKEKLSCEIIATGDLDKLNEANLSNKPIPTGKACSHVWLDMHGNINSHMWLRIIITILYYVVFRPGITTSTLSTKMLAVLGFQDFNSVVNWLVDTECIAKGEYNSLWAKKDWFSVLGS